MICLDCVGNRSFCRPGFDAVVPTGSDEESVLAAMHVARGLSAAEEAAFVENGLGVAARHTLGRERAAFHELLASVASLW